MATVGRIIRPHGNRGQVMVAPETDFGEDRFRVGETLLVHRSEAVEPLTITASREHDGRWVLGFEGVDSIDAAESWRGQELRVPIERLRTLEPGSFYVHDLIGCLVDTLAGERVGVVGKVDTATGVPMLVVAGRGEVLVPFIDAICRTVDLGARRIVIDPPTGLVELNLKKT